MTGQGRQQLHEPGTLDIDGPVSALRLWLIDGAVSVVGRRGSGSGDGIRIEVSEIGGEPLLVEQEAGAVTIRYRELNWRDFLSRPFPLGRDHRRRAVVSVSIPEELSLSVGVVGAATVLSGLSGPTEVRTVGGTVTLGGLSGPVDCQTTSGDLEAQELSGPLRLRTVSGGMTLVAGSSATIDAESVNGGITLDLAESADGATPREVSLSTVSGTVALRVPERPGYAVRARSVGGSLSSEFDGLRSTHRPGFQGLGGLIGDGSGELGISTVSGDVTLLRRPPSDAVPSPSSAAHKDL